LEWVQNRIGYYWSEERVNTEIQNLLGKALDQTIEFATQKNISLRLAAAVLAVSRVAKAAELRGVYA